MKLLFGFQISFSIIPLFFKKNGILREINYYVGNDKKKVHSSVYEFWKDDSTNEFGYIDTRGKVYNIKNEKNHTCKKKYFDMQEKNPFFNRFEKQKNYSYINVFDKNIEKTTIYYNKVPIVKKKME